MNNTNRRVYRNTDAAKLRRMAEMLAAAGHTCAVNTSEEYSAVSYLTTTATNHEITRAWRAV